MSLDFTKFQQTIKFDLIKNNKDVMEILESFVPSCELDPNIRIVNVIIVEKARLLEKVIYENLDLEDLKRISDIVNGELVKRGETESALPELDIYREFFRHPTLKVAITHDTLDFSRLKGKLTVPFKNIPFESECFVSTRALNQEDVKMCCIKSIKNAIGHQIMDCFAIEEQEEDEL